MPQLEIATFFSQLFWLFICFGLLISVSVGFFLPRVSLIQGKRWEKIEGTREQADHLKDQSQEVQRHFELHLSQARQTAGDRFLQATKEMTHLQEARKAEISALLKQQFREAEEKVLHQKVTLSPQVDSISASLTADIVQKALQDFTIPSSFLSAKDHTESQKKGKAS